MSNNYLIPVWDSISAAWGKVSGAKASIWAALGIVILIMIIFGILEYATKSVPTLKSLITFIGQVVNFLLNMGILYIGIRRAQDQPISYDQMFRSFQGPIFWRLIGMYILQILLFLPFVIIAIVGGILMTAEFSGAGALGVLCLAVGIIGTIIIGVRMTLAAGFVVDQGAGPWQCIALSFKATKNNFWRIVLIFFIEMVTIVISMIPIFIGLIWTLPFAFILYGIVYTRLLVNTTPEKVTPTTPVASS